MTERATTVSFAWEVAGCLIQPVAKGLYS